MQVQVSKRVVVVPVMVMALDVSSGCWQMMVMVSMEAQKLMVTGMVMVKVVP